ncbi:MAG: zf-HC2 domain-containing protein [Clostridiales bacterium]|nr:zf-HC2 domain-containing protein [Clostridiales bacterium]
MNDIPCGVIRDLLPLYTEDLCSEESKALVESHLKNCPDCRRLKENMKKTEPLPVDSGEGLKKIKKELINRRLRTAAMAALLVFVLLVSFFSWYSKPEYYPYSENRISVRDLGDKIEIRFTGVARASLETREDPEGGTMAILYAWTSPMDRRSKIETMTIPKVDALYYCWETQGENTVLLAGETDAAGMQVLPRLVLGYYVYLALLLGAVSALLWLLLRKKEAGALFRQIFFVPVSYLTGHVLIMGFQTLSFDAGRDFGFILMAACGVYAILTLLCRELRQRKQDRA